MSKTLLKRVGAVGVAVAACAACCAPLIAAPVIAAIATGGAGLLVAGQMSLAVLLLAGSGIHVFLRQRRIANRRAAAIECGCAPGAGCNVGDACELPQTQGPTS